MARTKQTSTANVDMKRAWFAANGARDDEMHGRESSSEEEHPQPSQLEQLSTQRNALVKRAKILSSELQVLEAEIVVADAGVDYWSAIQVYRSAKAEMEEKFRIKWDAMMRLKEIKKANLALVSGVDSGGASE